MMSSLRVSEPRRCLEVCRVLTGFQWVIEDEASPGGSVNAAIADYAC